MSLRTDTTTAEAPFFPMPRSCPYDAPPQQTAFREEGGLHRVTIWDGSTHWLATRHADVRAVLSDDRFSADVRRAGFPTVHSFQPQAEGGKFLRLDDPEHSRLRQMLTREFSVKRTRAMREQLLALTDELIDAMLLKGSADIVADYALPMPSQAICLILGVPYADRDVFQRHASVGTDLTATESQRHDRMVEAVGYYTELIERKRREPGDDMISRLLRDHTGSHGFSPEELPGLVALLVGAGHETTANMISLSVLALLRNPDVSAQLRARPELAPGAAEELLRYWSIVSTDPRRIATDDVEIGGQLVRRGEGVIVGLIAANRDPEAFPAGGGVAGPDEVDLGRNARSHVAFGFGTHQCLGQNLARVEMQVALPRLLERIPDLRVAVAADDIAFRPNSIVYGLTTLPVTWGPR